MSGWIKLHRQIQNHWLWLSEKPFDKRSAWIDILLLANHDDNKILLGNELVTIKRGEHITSEPILADRWGWSRTKVRNFLNLLEKDGMLVNQKEGKKRTRLKVLSYNDYQGLENNEKTTEEQVKDNEKTSGEQGEDINKNDKNDKNDIYILTESEEIFLNTLSKIENYPLDRKRDLEMYRTLADRYPELDLTEAIEQWRVYKLDKPLTEKSNPRSQINMAFKKYLEWGKCLKGVDNNGISANKGNNVLDITAKRDSIKKDSLFRKKLG